MRALFRLAGAYDVTKQTAETGRRYDRSHFSGDVDCTVGMWRMT